MNTKSYQKSKKLDNVCYDIRGPVLETAMKLEQEGNRIIKLNIGNPAPFGFNTPDELVIDLINNIQQAQGYTDSKGIYSARKAIMQYYQTKGILNLEIDNIVLGNGVSELISMSMQALLNNGDEILVPAPDYPLWTASITLSGGKAVHYLCDEENEWNPSIEDIKSKITDNTKGIVVINPNNPTGAVYSKEILQEIVNLAEKKGLIIFADEIYEKILYNEAQHIYLASLVKNTLCVTFNGLSKAYRAAGFRVGWMSFTGNLKMATDYMEGINMLSNMRLCSNAPGQYAVQAALGGYQSILDLTAENGRLFEQQQLVCEWINKIPALSVVPPKGALYVFPKINQEICPIHDDQKMIQDLLIQKKILLVQGTGFNWTAPDHFRIVFLPHKYILNDAMEKIGDFFESYRQ